MEQLQHCTAGIEVVRGLRIGHLWNEGGLGGSHSVPVDVFEEGMCLEFFGAVKFLSVVHAEWRLLNGKFLVVKMPLSGEIFSHNFCPL